MTPHSYNPVENCRLITVESFKFLGVGQFSWIVVSLLICGDLFLWMLPFLVSVRNLTHLKFVFIEDVNSWGRTNLEYHEN